MSKRFQQPLLICTILAGCASPSSAPPKQDSESAIANEHIAKLEDKITELETRLTALNEKINLENGERTFGEKAAIALAKGMPSTKITTEKVQPSAAAKNAVIPSSSKSQNKFAESFQQDGSTDRYREAKILYESNRPADAVLEFSDFLKDNPRHALASNAQYYIGMGYLQQKEYKLAEEELSRVLINYPHSNAVPDTLLALAKVSDLLQKPARVAYFKEKLHSHFANSPQAKMVASASSQAKPAEEKSAIETPHHPEPPTAPVPEMNKTDANGVEPSVVNQ